MDFNSLIAQVVDTLGSQITTAQATALLPFVEARLNRIIDHPSRELEAYATPVSAATTLPTDCWRVRDVARDDTADVSLRQMTPDAARTLYGLDNGQYVAYSIQGSSIKLWPIPTASSTDRVIIRYQQTIPALSSSATTNWLINSYPDIYYYGLLVQSEAYITNDERVGMWKTAFDEALSELALDAKRRRYGASPLVAYPYSYA